MVFVIKGKKDLEERPTYVEMVDDSTVTIHESEDYEGEYLECFKTTIEYYNWAEDNIEGFGKPIG